MGNSPMPIPEVPQQAQSFGILDFQQLNKHDYLLNGTSNNIRFTVVCNQNLKIRKRFQHCLVNLVISSNIFATVETTQESTYQLKLMKLQGKLIHMIRCFVIPNKANILHSNYSASEKRVTLIFSNDEVYQLDLSTFRSSNYKIKFQFKKLVLRDDSSESSYLGFDDLNSIFKVSNSTFQLTAFAQTGNVITDVACIQNGLNITVHHHKAKIWDNLLLQCVHQIRFDTQMLKLIAVPQVGLYFLCADEYSYYDLTLFSEEELCLKHSISLETRFEINNIYRITDSRLLVVKMNGQYLLASNFLRAK